MFARLMLVIAWATVMARGQIDSAAEPPDRPNFLWITAEDTSVNLACFDDEYARTPNLDAMARQGVRFTRAFSSAPVCSPVRCGIITGMYATSLGTQRLRSQFPVPPQVQPFTAGLRSAGYYCSNNVKTDYNLKDEGDFIGRAWDDRSAKAHWRKRKAGQPFFAIFNIETTHQSRVSVWPYKQFEKEVASRLKPDDRHDPAKAPLPPYYPDTPEVRRTLARYYDCMTVMDQEAGELLRQLDEDGLAENTIVFFYPDHGRGLPRGKRVLHDTGLQIPLIIRFPEKYRSLAPVTAGSVCERLISTVDFGPTVLSLAELSVPSHMQGIAFAGASAGKPRELVFGQRDRVDEVIDLSRSVRDGRYLYIRNFMPHLSWMPPEAYSDQSDMRRELRRLAAEGKLNADQMTYAAPRRPPEELYDSQSDPHQIHNLADSPAQKEVLQSMRSALRRWVFETHDVGFLTEPQVWQRIRQGGTPWDLAHDPRRYPLGRLFDAAELVGRPDGLSRQIELLTDPDDGVRYWAGVGLHAAQSATAEVHKALHQAMKDDCAVVRIEAAAALVERGDTQAALPVLEWELRGAEGDVVLHAARAAELLGESARPLLPTMRQVLATAKKRDKDCWQFVAFALGEAVAALESR